MRASTALLFLAFACPCLIAQDVDVSESSAEALAEGEARLSATFLHLLKHFQQPDPVGLPGVGIPDPWLVPDFKTTLQFGTKLHLKPMAAHGISKLRFLDVNAEIGAMEGQAVMLVDELQVRGNYTMGTWIHRAQGPFTVYITGLKITAKANLGVERDGKLRVQDILMDMSSNTTSVNFINAGFFGTMLQGMVNSIGNLVFDSIKPYILKEAYTQGRVKINKKLDEVAGDMQFPNSILPLDMVIADARGLIRERGFDPYKIVDCNYTNNIFFASLYHTCVTGAMSVHRVGNITMKIQNNTVIADFKIGTQKLEGTTQWNITALAGLLYRAGTASFSVEYIVARVVVEQPLDTRRTPKLRNVDLEVGNIQVRCNGAGTLDYLVEFVVNILPNLLRYQIMDSLQAPIKEKIQTYLNNIDVEEKIIDNLVPEVDKFEEKGLKLSAILSPRTTGQSSDEDEFFNF